MTTDERQRHLREVRQHQLQKEHEFGELLLDRYAGKWVAVRGQELIADADSADQLYEQLSTETCPYRSFRVKRKPGAALLGFRRG